MANTSKKDVARVLAGEKRVRAWKSYIQANPRVVDPCDKDGNRKQVRARYPRKPVEYVPEVVDKEQAILSGGVTPGVPMRSADSKFGRMHREFSGQILQGKVQVSLVDGHVYGSIQKVGRTLQEAAQDEGYGRLGAIVGKRSMHEPPARESRSTKSPYKRRWKDSTFELVKKG